MLLPYARWGLESEGVCAALARMPLFEGVRLDAAEAERLSGALTNRSYKVTVNGGVYVLRLAGEGTREHVDRAAEGHNARVAAAAGVNAEVLYFDARDGTMLTRFVDGVPLAGEGLRSDPDALSRAALALRRVHRLGKVFRLRFDVFARIERYREILIASGATPPEDFRALERDAEAVRRALRASPAHLTPSHNDPWPGNLLDTGERVCVIDWEYSGMNDPVWDLADLSIEAGLGPEAERTMLEVYRGGPAPPALRSRVALYKAMSDLHWSIWASVQHAHGNPAEDFRAYALGRLERCKRQMGDPEFGRHLGAVAASRAGSQHSPVRIRRTAGTPRPTKLRSVPPDPVEKGRVARPDPWRAS